MDVTQAGALLAAFWTAANDSPWGQALNDGDGAVPRMSWVQPVDMVANRRGPLPLLALTPLPSQWPTGFVDEPLPTNDRTMSRHRAEYLASLHVIASNPITAGRDVWAFHDGWSNPLDHYSPSPASLSATVTAITAAERVATELDSLDGTTTAERSRAYRRESDAMRAFAVSLAPFLDSLAAPWLDHALSVISAQRAPKPLPIISRGHSARVPI